MQIHKSSFLFLTLSLYLAIYFPLQAQLQRFKDNKSCLYGYTDQAGKRIIPAQYVYAEEFDRNYAVVGNGAYNGLLDTTGKFILPLNYTQISNYENWFLLKKDSSYSIFDIQDKKIHCEKFPYPITRYRTSYVIFQHGEYCGLACNEKIVVDSAYRIEENSYTDIVIVHYGPYDNDSIRLYDVEKNAFVNQNFYKQVYQQGHDYYSVKKDNLYGMIDKNGNTVIPFSYTNLYQHPYNYGPLVMRRKDNKGYDVYSRHGEKQNRKPYSFIDTSLIEKNLYLITQKHKHGMLNSEGIAAIPCVYDSIIPLETNSAYVLLYQRKGIQIASYSGKILNEIYYNNICFPKHISKRDEESEYYPEDELLPLLVNIWPDSSVSIITSDDLTEHKTGSDYQMSADVRLYTNGKYGFLSADLEHVVLPAYDMIFPFGEDQYYTSILNEERFGIMTRNGEVIIQPEYLFIEQNTSSTESFIFMSEDYLFGIKNSAGEIIIQPAFSALSGYDFENDYCWAQYADSTELRLVNSKGALKSLYDFEYPVSLSMQKNTIARVRVSDTDEEIYKTGVLNCTTLQPVVPFIYEKIAAITDSMYLCMMEENYTDLTYSDLYIYDVRIDSVTGFSVLPNHIIAIERCNKWGYFKNGAWLIRPDKKTLGLSSEERALLQLNSQTITDPLFNLYEEEYEITLQFDSSAISDPLSRLLNNEILLWYCNDQKRSFSIMDDYGYSYDNEPENTPLLYTVDYVNTLIDAEDEVYEDDYYGYSSYFSSTFREISATVLTSSFAELRYTSEHWDRASYEKYRDNKQYTITTTNQLKQLSLADITNHPNYKALLSILINTHLDALEDIELPCTDRDNIIELTTGYQFEKDGMRFYFKDERSDVYSYDEEEIDILIPYNELVISFRKSVYISELYRNSLKQ